MHAYLIIGTQQNFKPKLTELLGYPVSQSDPDILEITSETSVGIDDIRQVQRYLAYPPTKSPKKVVLIPEAEKLTPEAQNALLKTLEEPPSYAVLCLNTQNTSLLLPTVISRCQEVPNTQTAIDQPSNPKVLSEIESKTLPELWRHAAQKGKTKQQALEWVRELIAELRSTLHRQPNPVTLRQLKAAQRAVSQLHSNVQPSLVLEGLLTQFRSN